MKSLTAISVIMLLALASCQKKYEEKSGTFYGHEVYWEGSYDQADTITYALYPAIYTLTYNKGYKNYTLTNNSVHFPVTTIPREDLKDNEAGKAGVGFSVDGWTIVLEGNSIEASYTTLNLDVYKVVSFEGDKD